MLFLYSSPDAFVNKPPIDFISEQATGPDKRRYPMAVWQADQTFSEKKSERI